MKYLIILLSLFATTAHASSWTYSRPTGDGGNVVTQPGYAPIVVRPAGDGYMRYNPNDFRIQYPRTHRQFRNYQKNHVDVHNH